MEIQYALYCNNNGKSLEWTKVYLIALNIQTLYKHKGLENASHETYQKGTRTLFINNWMTNATFLF